tara:strand:- start:3765 stop:4274 length:510 start_codon:yes stop_codon:yes gene_type:complete
MGMDVHGLNPKENKTFDDFPILKEMESVDFNKKWEILEADKEKTAIYWKQKDEFDKANPGVYFRNNCWWWRPLWDYCFSIDELGLISMETYEAGHSNSGAGLNDEDAKLLGALLLTEIANGGTEKYQAEYQQRLDDLNEDDFSKHYPFDIDNVKAFALFCLESGGFEIL